MDGEHMMSGGTPRSLGLVNLERRRQKEKYRCFPLLYKEGL